MKNSLSLQSSLLNEVLGWNPSFNFNETVRSRELINKTEDGVTLSLEVPGITSEELEITESDNILVIEGGSKSKPIFKRYSLSEKADKKKIEAKLEYGVLKITVPYKDSKSRKIPIK